MNSMLLSGKWEQSTQERTVTGALKPNSYGAPIPIWVHIHQTSQFYQSQGLQRLEETHRGLTYERGMKVHDRITLNTESYIITSVNEQARFTLLGLKNESK